MDDEKKFKIDADVRGHILQGDESGGGHRAGQSTEHPLKNHYTEVHAMFRALLDDPPILALSKQDEAEHYLKVNELGLAFDSLTDALENVRERLTQKQMEAIVEIARKMNLSPPSWATVE